MADWSRYIRNRRSGLLHPPGSNGGSVGNRAIEQDLKLARAIFNWAVLYKLIPAVPMAEGKIPTERNPRRVILFEEDYQRMLEIADEISPKCRLALVLGHETGRRINALRQLKWSDLHRERQVIVWPAATDKQRKEHVGAINKELEAELSRHSADEGGLLFPSPRIPGQALGREVFVRWWADILAKAGISHVRGLGWHSLRRKWANEHKHHHDTEVAAAGGWNDTQTLRKCYYQTDTSAIHKVAAERIPLRRSPAP